MGYNVKAKTKIYPVYVVRDADVGAESVHPSVISAFRKWADADSRFEGIGFVMMTTATEPVQANLYPELRPDGHFYVKPRAKKAVMAPAPFFVERHDLEVTATKHPIEMILAVFMGPEIFKAYGDTDIDDAMGLAMYGEEVEDELSLIAIANGGD